MKLPVRLAALLAFLLAPCAAIADSGSSLSGGGGGGGGGGSVTVIGPLGISTAPASAVSVSCVSGCQAGAVSNALGGQSATSTNLGAVSWNYGWNSVTSKWDQVQLDANDSLKIVVFQGASPLGVTNGSYANILQGNAALSATNALFTNVVISGAALSATNGLYTNVLQGNIALGPTNGLYANLLQGNAIISATNGLYFNLLQGNSVIGSGNPIFANVTNGIVGTNTGVACGTSCMIGVQGNVTATDIPVSVAGTAANTASAVASTSNNVRSNSYLYGYNGTTWDQLQVDASKFLKVNCATGCAGGTTSNASSGVATSSTNGAAVSWLYGFNGTTWDQLQVDGAKLLKVNVAAGSISAATGFNVSVTGTPFTATTAGVTSAAFTSSTQVVVTNAGSVNGAYCAPGASATTSSQYIAPNGGWFGFYAGGGITQISCITAAGTTTINILGGAGLPTGVPGAGAPGSFSNATSGVATSSTNLPTVSYNYVYNGTTWDQMHSGGNAASGVATSASGVVSAQSFTYAFNGTTWDQTRSLANSGSGVSSTSSGNLAAVSYNYGYNGATWDQLQVDANKALKIVINQAGAALGTTNGIYANLLQGNAAISNANGLFVAPTTAATWSIIGATSNASSAVATNGANAQVVSYSYGFNGTTWDQLQVDASKFLKINCAVGCASGSTSNASSGVATSSTNGATVSYNYAFNGTTWDQLQDDANKSLITVLKQGAAVLSATNGLYANILQGNAVLGPTNTLPVGVIITNPTSVLTRPATAVTQATSMTCATPSVFTWTSTPLVNGQTVILTGTPCTGFSVNTVYYVVGKATSTYNLAATLGGAAIAGTGTQSGVNTTLVYAQGDLIASNATAGSIVVPSVTATGTSAGTFYVRRFRLVTNDTVSYANYPIQVNFWSAAPTYTNGDASTYAAATGSANYLGSFGCTFQFFGDGSSCQGAPLTGDEMGVALASGTTIFWDIQATGSNTVSPTASKTFTITLEDWRNN